MTPPGDAVDGAGCSAGQRVALACDPDHFRRRGPYVVCVVREILVAKRDGLVRFREFGALLRAALRRW